MKFSATSDNECKRYWLSQPWKSLTVEFRQDKDTQMQTFTMMGNILRELQYIFQHELDYANTVLHNMCVYIVRKTDDFKIQLISEEEYTEDRIKAELQKLALKPKSFSFKLDPVNRPTHIIPSQIADKKAIAFYEHGEFYCVARDDDVLDDLLIKMDCNEIETIDLTKSELDLISLGIEHAGIHPNLKKVEVDETNTPNRCVFSWRGRKKADAVDLIKSYKSQCKKVEIVFESFNGESSTDWTNLAIEFMFESKSKLKLGYFEQFKKSLYDKNLQRQFDKLCRAKGQYRARYCALEHSDKKIWLYSPEDDACVARLKSDIEGSISKHCVRKGLRDVPAMRDFLQKHQLKCIIKKDTIICTHDLDVAIVTILSHIPNSASTEPFAQAKHDGNGIQYSERDSVNNDYQTVNRFNNQPHLI